MNTKNIVIGVLAALALLFGTLYLVTRTANVGVVAGAVAAGQQHYQTESFQQGLQLGQRGSIISQALFGKCNVSQTTSGSQAATTTAEFTCAVTGVKAGDTIVGDMPVGAGNNPNGSGSTYGGFVLVAAYATSTGVVAFQIANYSGAATSSFAQATTGVEYLDLR